MCGIIGYVGEANPLPILLDGLKRLEYRGYDSAGVALLADNSLARLQKSREGCRFRKINSPVASEHDSRNWAHSLGDARRSERR